MQFGVTLTSEDDVRATVELAVEAETAGWDGVFLWDGVTGNDPWVVLSAIAARTERLKLSTMLTPLSRRRPWKVAQEVATLDQVSGGRAILPVGLGAPETGFGKFGEEVDRKVRASLLDESIDILTGLWSGEPFRHEGTHYQIDEVTFAPLPVQRPRVPIWVVGAWPRMKSMRRVLRCDGIIPEMMDGGPEPTTAEESWAKMTPEGMQEIRKWLQEHGKMAPDFDIVWEGDTPGDDPARAAEIARMWADSGVTWWLEAVWNKPRTRAGLEGMRERILQGPPRG